MKLTPKRLMLLVVLALVAGLCTYVSIRQFRVNASQTGVIPGSLHALAQTTLNEGGNSAEVLMPIYDYGPAEDMNQVRSDYSVVVAHPVSSNSYIWDDEYQIIGTWYKFVVTETLSTKPYPTCDTCPLSPDPPSELSVGVNELLVPKFGGVVSINGVTLTSTDPNFPDYQSGQSYLLFLEIDPSKKVGMLAGGPVAAYSVSSSGVLSPVTQMRSFLGDEISQNYGNSLSALRASLASPAPTPTPGASPCTVSNHVKSICANNGGTWDMETCTCN